MNTEETPPPAKMTVAEKAALASGCTFVLLVNLAWAAVALLIVMALIKFVFG